MKIMHLCIFIFSSFLFVQKGGALLDDGSIATPSPAIGRAIGLGDMQSLVPLATVARCTLALAADVVTHPAVSARTLLAAVNAEPA